MQGGWQSQQPTSCITISRTVMIVQQFVLLDAELLSLVRRHDCLWSDIGKMAENDPRIDTLVELYITTACLILIMPAQTRAGIEAKRRIYARERGTFTAKLVEATIIIDEERISRRSAGVNTIGIHAPGCGATPSGSNGGRGRTTGKRVKRRQRQR